MEKKCFILMPPSEPEGYAKGHFNRVYQYIIAAACRQAGCSPVRLGDPLMDDTPMGILNTIIESDLLICDISSNNNNVMYGFAIRQALNLPVVLIKDLKTNVQASIPEFEVMEYDESLRIDTVENEVPALGEALKKALEAKSEPNNILTRLNIASKIAELPPPSFIEPIAVTVTQEQETEKAEEQLPFISPVPDYVGGALSEADIERLKVGDSFFHMNYGKGDLLAVNKQTKDYLVKVRFESGIKMLVLSPSDIFRKITA